MQIIIQYYAIFCNKLIYLTLLIFKILKYNFDLKDKYIKKCS